MLHCRSNIFYELNELTGDSGFVIAYKSKTLNLTLMEKPPVFFLLFFFLWLVEQQKGIIFRPKHPLNAGPKTCSFSTL